MTNQIDPQMKKGIRLTLLILLVVTTLLSSGCGDTQAASKTYRVGIISGVDAFASIGDGFIAKMKELGYQEGDNIVYDFQKVNADKAKVEEVINKFVADKVDLIFAFPTEPAILAKAATEGTNIPVVFAGATLESVDLIKSVREPGGNLTGLRAPSPDITVKRFEILLEIAPQVKRLLLFHNPNYPVSVSALEVLQPAADAVNVELVVVPITSVDDIVADLQARDQAEDIEVEAILIMPEIVAQSPPGWKAISEFAAKHKLPIGGSLPFAAEKGAIFSYFPDNIETGELAAPLADKILRGTPAGTIPVVTPESRLIVNYKRAQELGLTVPEGILSQAIRIIR